MARKTCLLIGSMMPMIEEQIDAEFDLHRFVKGEDTDGLLARIGNSVELIATGGHAAIGPDIMDACPNLKIIANFGVGYDTVDAGAAGERGIIVTNTPDVLTEEVADTTLGLLLMTCRELGAAERYLRDGKWDKDGNYPLTQTTLRDRKVGILGLGRIGNAIAKRCEAFGLTVEYHTRTQKVSSYAYHDTLLGLATSVDTLISVVPGGAATDKLINLEILTALGPNGVLINVGRGTTVDEQALIKALQDGVIASAGLDVFEKEPSVPAELIAMDKITLLPHVGSASIHTRDGMGQLVVDNLKAYANGTAPISPVPETPFSGW